MIDIFCKWPTKFDCLFCTLHAYTHITHLHNILDTLLAVYKNLLEGYTTLQTSTCSIAVVVQVDSGVVLDGVVDKDTDYDFCMCNPPFFHDAVDREGEGSNRTGMRPSPPNPSSSKATDCETLTEGGEVQFVGQILADSLKLRTKIRYIHIHIYCMMCMHTYLHGQSLICIS